MRLQAGRFERYLYIVVVPLGIALVGYLMYLVSIRDTPRSPSSPRAKEDCVLYPFYPSTIICQRRYMYHLQPGGRAFMGDLMQPHTPLPPLHRNDNG